MNGGRKAKGRYDAAMVHDGSAWRLFVRRGESVEETARAASPSDRIPEVLMEKATEARVRSVRFLISGELYTADGLVLDGLSLSKAEAAMASAVSETAGVESDGMLFIGCSCIWPGVRKPFSLIARFDADAIETLKATLDGYGMACAGFGSLETAIFAVWRGRVSGKAALAAVGFGHTLVVPAPRGANTGPQTVQCGMRHFAMDEQNWLARFQRGAASIAKAGELRIVALPARAEDVQSTYGAAVCDTLRDSGYGNVVEENADEWIRTAAREALSARANRIKGVALPISNPYEPRKRFSNGWIVIAALAVLAVPAAFRIACDAATEAELMRIGRESAKYAPLESRVTKARASLESAKREYERETTSMAARIAERRPLVAFVEVAHFLCRSVGPTVMLESVEEKGLKIEVRGTFTDPEDGVELGKGLMEFSKAKGIEIVESVSKKDEGVDTGSLYRFSYALDCTMVGERRR